MELFSENLASVGLWILMQCFITVKSPKVDPSARYVSLIQEDTRMIQSKGNVNKLNIMLNAHFVYKSGPISTAPKDSKNAMMG